MGTSVGRMPWVGLLLLFTAGGLAAEPPAEKLSAWIRDLNDGDFAVRQEARKQLAAAGPAAIDALLIAARGHCAETARQAAESLEQIAATGDDATCARIVTSVAQQKAKVNPALSRVAVHVSSDQQNRRQARALAELRRLGARLERRFPPLAVQPFVSEPSIEPPLPPSVALAPPPDVRTDVASSPPTPVAIADAFVADDAPSATSVAVVDVRSPNSIALDRNWRGDVTSLALLGDLPHITFVSIQGAALSGAAVEQLASLPNLQEVEIERTEVPSDALWRLREKRPNARIIARGRATLGAFASWTGPCILNGVMTTSNAHRRGLAAGDNIVAIDGHPIRNFSDLAIALYPHRPGERVNVALKRGASEQSIDVILDDRMQLEKDIPEGALK
jgi:hypothetical protein